MEGSAPALLVVSDCSAEREFLGALLRKSGWEVHLARTLVDVMKTLRIRGLGVVLSESRLPDGHNWKDLLDEFQGLETAPLLIVTDRLADERLWSEVLNLGGYDVLLKPLEREEVLRVADSAWTNWKINRGKSLHAAA